MVELINFLQVINITSFFLTFLEELDMSTGLSYIRKDQLDRSYKRFSTIYEPHLQILINWGTEGRSCFCTLQPLTDLTTAECSLFLSFFLSVPGNRELGLLKKESIYGLLN
ncbi:hypothetical protein F2P56_014044, partial [Juglans regia]